MDQFMFSANQFSWPDYVPCEFYNSNLNTACRARLSEDGPRGNLAAYVEWTLTSNKSSFVACAEWNTTEQKELN